MELIFKEKVNQPFIDKAIDVSYRLGIDPNWLMAIINFESAGTFSPSIKNNLGYVGLIQFGKVAAERIGTTTEKLQQMSAVEQLEYVYKYYYPYRKKINSYVDMYLATLFPVAVGKPLTYVLQTRSLPAAKIAAANPIFDKDKDAKITVEEVRNKMLDYIPTAWQTYFRTDIPQSAFNKPSKKKCNPFWNCGCFGDCPCMDS
ncbi:lysozyme family protein [Tenacibaculum caenipelagi]|uniref:Transglycosylase-like protein with SLT domain n=1 Tax=Tenacibaculum caenipelagi TaxID=1325435 RepID=A0A4R6TF66_9FLAO|nr:hypothetical protein [Tenacibaculum caenipelagi]TDQ22742.1 hypothetical protein DFQ07_2760 [Tenacibaculum caenipelagi]